VIDKKHDLNRREILYVRIISRMMLGNFWYGDYKTGRNKTYEDVKDEFHLTDDVKEGDIVICSSSIYRQSHIFVIGRLLKYDYNATSVIEDLMTGDLCDYGNESYVAIRNLPNHLLITDKQYKFWRKFANVCYKIDSYEFIPCDCSFDDKEKIAIFETREKWTNKTIKHTLKYGMTIKAISEYLQNVLEKKCKQ